jgi:hypothetical protein
MLTTQNSGIIFYIHCDKSDFEFYPKGTLVTT